MRTTDFRTAAETQNEIMFSEHNLLLLDETVHEVFGVMLGFHVSPGKPGAGLELPGDEDHQTSIISFAGSISGLCEINLTQSASVDITSAMMGGPPVAADSEWVCDAIGELCNLLAGGWKNRIPGLGAGCTLSIPTVIAGSGYHVHRSPELAVNRRAFSFAKDHLLLLSLMYDPVHLTHHRG